MYQSGESLDRRRKARQLCGPFLAAVIIAIAASGCGGSAGDDTDSAVEVSEGQDASGNYANVTIGSDTFEVPPDGLNLCNSLDNQVFGSFAVAGDGSATQAGGTDAAIQVNFAVPVTDWEDQGLQAPTVNLDLLDDGIRWFASVERGLGSVDSWELADGMATGRATFEAEEVGSGTVVGSESGSFEIVCQ